MSWFSERRAGKRLGTFIGSAITHGGSFRTTCTAEQVLSWAAEFDGQKGSSLVERTADSVTLKLRNNQLDIPPSVKTPADVGSRHLILVPGGAPNDRITVRASADQTGSYVDLILQRTNTPRVANISAAGAVGWILSKVDGADPAWTVAN